ncbi:MAG: hypothetical protein LRZ85_09515 [Alphaproteobacteria bacterium]|nr:hypothetical protein [Alphaproteobacteria bacterium]MCD8520514.1 hypothetical protein [Alphaproteobacteria bacterium]MCD8570643.1 hypothetical protein [Alphaproteobacteria bacterium]
MSNVREFIRAHNDNKKLPPHYDYGAALGEIIANALLEAREARGIKNPARNLQPSTPSEPEPQR